MCLLYGKENTSKLRFCRAMIGGNEMANLENANNLGINYGDEFTPCKKIMVIKKDGSLEAFNVQKVIDAVGKSAYRALTKFTDDELVLIDKISLGL